MNNLAFPKPAKQKRTDKQRLVTRLDDKARQLIHSIGFCERCGYPAGEWCHIIGRTALHTRFLLENALSLCHECHVWFDGRKNESREWFDFHWPGRYRYLQRIANQSGGYIDFESIERQLTPSNLGLRRIVGTEFKHIPSMASYGSEVERNLVELIKLDQKLDEEIA